MKRLAIAALLACAAGCPSSGSSNPERLWLYIDGVETEVKLIDYEPPPF